ncbi:protein IMPAIRED IN BABA-INDUCED STERILITY 1 isoform X2 [Cornus florida]|uniref:protein IMPAIRED IN BABA-INDUCED STERILITY 1 isoform X2 n=1 Tax=Cornus florida TaxID=4283 RepID=UPI00289E024A|nr:protein IMPAIRED IN BABA-INDUCED STERILITY 1 isoform X2 [Cornus florida]
MGCVASKQSVSVTPAIDHSGAFRDNGSVCSGRSRGGLVVELEKKKKKKMKKRTESGLSGSELSESGRASSHGCGGGGESLSFRLGNLQKYVEGEQVAAGWPAWLSAVAGEAIHGWVPLKADSFEKLEKIGQGTYSSVFRARDSESGRIVALKKVRFDNFEPESVRFMAREIMILRRLDHPNIIKLEGLITSRLSCSIYLVFEYMEHDISGLLSSPDIKFTDAQVKCYMKQLLSGLEHCHSRGVMHRDIKGANLLVNNEGILKIADFGLANFCRSGPSGHRQPLTSRVITLWYRPPELLLGSTDYGASVDLWSVGCVFAELLLKRPILQGRTEVEQLHKIFKLCGSPPDEYWKKSKLPHATLFKPQHRYESCLWETFKELPKTAVNLVETLLSVEPCNRGSASSALASEYFTTKPYACDPSSLPKYPPSKEIDAKHREEARRKRPGGRVRGPETTRKPTRKPNGLNKLAPAEDLSDQTQGHRKINDNNINNCKERDIKLGVELPKPSISVMEEASHIKNASQGDIPFSGPLQVSGSSGFAWAKRRKDELSSVRSRSRSSSRSLIFEPSGALHLKNNSDSKRHENAEVVYGSRTNSKGHDPYETVKHAILKDWSQLERPDSFDASDGYHSQELSLALYQGEELAAKRFSLVRNMGSNCRYQFKKNRVPLADLKRSEKMNISH